MSTLPTPLREEAEPAAMSAELAHMLECIRCADTVCGLVLSKEEVSLLACHLEETRRALSLEKQRAAGCVNSMPPAWCATRVAEIRKHLADAYGDAGRNQYRTWLIELLSQLDSPPAQRETRLGQDGQLYGPEEGGYA